MQDNSINNKRIAKNTLFLYGRMLLTMIVSLYTSRVILNVLGVEDFGTYNVVAGFVSMFSFFNSSLSSCMQRFYNFEGARRGENGIRDVYSAGVVIHAAIAIILVLILESIGLWYINTIMVVPPDRLYAVNFIYQLSVVSAVIVIMQTPYTGIIMAKEKMNYYALISVVDVTLKLVVVLVLPHIPSDKLTLYAFLILVVTVIDFICYFAFSKKKFSYLKVHKHNSRELYKKILSFSGWNLIGTFAFMMKGQGINMVLNLYFGPVVNAARGIAGQISGALSGFTANIMTAFRPQIVNSYAVGEIKRSVLLMFTESRICYFFVLLLLIPISLEIDYILRLWLGEMIPEHTGIFSVLVMLDALICVLNTPCTQIVWAVGHIRTYQILSSLINLLLLPASLLLLHFGFSATSVFIAVIFFSFINQCGCLYIANKLVVFGLKKYMIQVMIPCILATVLVPILPLIITYIIEQSFLRLIFICLSEIFVGIPVFYYLVINRQERAYLINYMKRK